MGADSGHQYCTHAGQGGAPPPEDLGSKISRPTAAGCTRIEADERGGCRQLGSSDFCIFRPLKTNPYLISTIFEKSELISVVIFSRFITVERYGKKKFGRLLDRVFRPPRQPLNQGKGTYVFLVSWAFH